MKSWLRYVHTLTLGALLMMIAVSLVCPTPAMAVNDSFVVGTLDGCGAAKFVDYGPGRPGGGNNDDYIRIYDLCKDGHGIRAYVWLNSIDLGSKYNGRGVGTLKSVVWDPFFPGHVLPGFRVRLKVCIVDGPGDDTGARCADITKTSVDG